MSKHTPGPWEYRNVVGAGLQIRGNPGPRNFGHYKWTGEGPLFLYTLRQESPRFDFADERWTQFPQAEWDEMQEANARLIAAAPELLEALVRLLRANEADYEHLPEMDVRTAFETNSMAVKQAREAIAKATEPQ